MKAILIFVALLSTLTILNAQKTISALRVSDEIKIDGIQNEEAWLTQVHVATDFTSIAPTPNQTPSQQTEVKIIYDDEAIYIAAHMRESSKDSIMQELSLRDQFGPNTDFFGVIIDVYGNGNNAIELMLSSAGVQFDTQTSPNNGDVSWDAVWYGESVIAEDGWYLEMKIPYAVLRFPKQKVQNWNINFFRKRAVDGTFHSWNNVDFEQNNAWLTHMGRLEGIEDIQPPLRLSFTPYATLYGIHSKDPNRDPISSSALSYNYGMDVKLGVNDAYTLDMTLIPDFGQARSDDQVLNLSPFEVRFSENRAFFTEGLDLFNKAGIFYSRRIGENQQLYNASKFTGRNKKGLAIGVFNAVGKENANTIYNEELNEEEKTVITPLTNYNVVVIDQDLKNNSSVSFTNTNVLRRGDQFHNANVSATTFNIKNKDQSFGISGRGALSQIINKTDAPNVLGHDMNVSFDKLNGAAVYGVSYSETSASYNHNDLGFFTRGNQRTWRAQYVKRDFDGFGTFNRFNYWANASYTRNIDPESYADANINVGMYAQTKSFFQFNIWGSSSPTRHDFFEARTAGRYYNLDSNYGGGFWLGTDYRKKLQFQLYGSAFNYNREFQWKSNSFGTYTRFRASNKLNIELDISINNEANARGYVTHSGEDIVFGSRDVQSVTNKFNINYTFNNKMGLEFRMRHFWSKVHYHEFYNLSEDGGLVESDFAQFKDVSFNAFTIDANYRWRFAPGSEIIIVWKNNISGVHANSDTDYSKRTYSDGLSSLGSLPQSNSLSIRFSYFLDYNTHLKKLL